MNVESIYGFTQHRFNLPHAPLKDLEGELIHDIQGRPMECEGSVLAQSWLDTFFAAVGYLHDKHGQNGGYIPQCAVCFHNFKGSSDDPSLSHKPCTHHQTQRYCNTGNPSSSLKIKQLRKWLKGEAVERGYQVSKKSPFFPSDLVEMQLYVMSRNFNLSDLRCYTMVLNAVETAMRFDGFQDAKFEHFERHHDLWQVHENKVHSLAQAVKEKNDHQWYIYEHTFRDCMPKQCFLRHLLVLIHCLNTSSGYLYPAQEYIKEGKASQGLFYSDFSKWLQDRLNDNCSNPQHADWGPHTPRRSFYLFSVLGGGIFQDIMRNARHRDEKTAKAYYEDAKALLARIMETPELTLQQRIWPFRDKLLHNDGRNMRRLNSFQSNHIRMESLKEVATTFVEKNLGVSRTSTQYRNAGYLLQISYRRNFTEQTPLTQYQDFTETLPVHFRQPAIGHFNNAVTYAQNLAALRPSLGIVNQPGDSIMSPTHANLMQPTHANHHLDPQFMSPTHASFSAGTRANYEDVACPGTPITPNTQTSPATATQARHAWPKKWIEIDTQQNMGKKVLCYKVVSHFAKQMKQKTPKKVALQLHELVLEVGNLHPSHSLPLQQRFIESRSSLRASRHVFSRYLNTFCKCLMLCHGSDIHSFNATHENFDPYTFHSNGGCVGCRDTKFQ
jgi:hypothetical protein